MESNQIIIALTGSLAGILHVLTGPDHLAAIAPLSADRSIKSWKIGLWWGIGHTFSVWLIGILVLLLRDWIPIEGISTWGEKVVGLVLIALGLWGLRKALKERIHSHSHEHGKIVHTHFHYHSTKVGHDHPDAHKHTHTSLGIGLLHGLAGSSHLLAILPVVVLPGLSRAILYMVCFGVGTILAMTCFSSMIGFFVNRFRKALNWIRVGFGTFAIVVGLFWLSMG